MWGGDGGTQDMQPVCSLFHAPGCPSCEHEGGSAVGWQQWGGHTVKLFPPIPSSPLLTLGMPPVCPPPGTREGQALSGPALGLGAGAETPPLGPAAG